MTYSVTALNGQKSQALCSSLARRMKEEMGQSRREGMITDSSQLLEPASLLNISPRPFL